MQLAGLPTRLVHRLLEWRPQWFASRQKVRSCHPQEPELRMYGDIESYRAYQSCSGALLAEQARVARNSIRSGARFFVSGCCEPCGKTVRFLVDEAGAPPRAGNDQWEPNWRERLVCPCGLNNRVRAALHVYRRVCEPSPTDKIYVTEQTTPLYGWLTERFGQVTGSEYLADTAPFGRCRDDGVRNESVTDLSFADNQFDAILSFDVLEHVPEYSKGLAEFWRVLKPGGTLLFSVPFVSSNAETLVRARMLGNGEIEHLLPPEYHGDPLSSAGCLCFYHFGWDMLDSCRAAGFADAWVVALWSREYGYLGPDQLFFFARK